MKNPPKRIQSDISTTGRYQHKGETSSTASNTPAKEIQSKAPTRINFERPKYPDYAILSKRISSFTEWPPSKAQAPRDMALAGFFYDGKGDNTRCFFCGGGLRNWEVEDDPWVEHARFFSKCTFVRQERGQQFIDAFYHRDKEMEENSEPQVNGKSHDVNAADATQEKEADSNDERNSKEEIMKSTVAKSIKEMGYSDENIKAARSIISRDKHRVSTQEILEVIFELGDNQKSSSPERLQRVETGFLEQSISSRDLESLKREDSSLMCRVCMEKKASIVFLPCGHITCCADCAPAVRKWQDELPNLDVVLLNVNVIVKVGWKPFYALSEDG
ncbi:baculoviral IAP repeat-containing protein 3-like [Saccostrea echinata]|uniref:baculoviral IAP repeat-containing protein 3-like n=1 Tax=Saccostrea echinata TaxID=191078 RepID=UPI002A8309CB|nr:baculoviral IAP repeat-containing protein 3-like [Saccostrea echinata]